MAFPGLNIIDAIILIVLGFSLLHGLIRGLIRTLLFLVTLVTAVAVLWLYSSALATWMEAFVPAEIAYAISFFVLFFGVMIMGNWAVAKVLTGMVSLAGLTIFDRILGGLFGLAWGAMLVCVVVVPLNAFFGETEAWTQSALVQLALHLIQTYSEFGTVNLVLSERGG